MLNEMLVEAGRSSTAIVDGTFKDLAEKWLGLSSQTLSPTTVREYRRLLDRVILPRFGDRKVRTLVAADLDSFYAFLGRSGGKDGKPLGAQSIRHVHALIRRLLNQAVKWNWIPASPAGKASPPRVPPRSLVVPTPDTLLQVITLAEERYPDLACFLRLAAVTGARRGELCALRWSDLQRSSLQISRSVYGGRHDQLREKDTKTHAVRRVSLDAATMDLLDEHRTRCRQRARSCGVALPERAFVFSDDPDGCGPWRPGRITLAFRRLCDEAGAPSVRLHDLRHFAATQLLAAGVPVRTVAGRLGHANAATTLNVYAHVLESSDEDAAAVLGDLLAN